jgi:hypothetical protein
MTVLALAQTCAKRLMLTSPSSFIGSTDNNMILLRAMLDQAIDEIRDLYPWPELQKEYTFTLATDTASYVLPSDYDRRLNDTSWNRTQARVLIGPVDAVIWQNYKSGLITTLPSQRFRVKGWTTNQFFIDPTPTSDLDGQTCVYEYISKTARRPKTWVASTSWSGIQYCSYNGNVYDRGATSAVSTGTTAPTHTSGAVSDGSITWTYLATEYTFAHDSDEVLLDNNTVIEGTVWRFKRERGLDYESLRQDAENQLEEAKTKLNGAPVVSMAPASASKDYIGEWSYPEGSFGV